VETDEAALLQLRQAIDAYTELHREAVRGLEPMVITADAAAIERAIDARAEAVRAARPEPRRGDLFTPAVERVLRTRIADALRVHGLTPADVLAEVMDEGEILPAPLPAPLRVNGPFPWHAASRMLRCIGDVLPEVPEELQYRFVGRDLVLVDIPASLVVDFLPRALADSRTAPVR
jgi:hypothetical protein